MDVSNKLFTTHNDMNNSIYKSKNIYILFLM